MKQAPSDEEKSEEPLYQLKVTLNRVKPPVWRRLLVPGSISLAQLHDVLQVAMGWTDSHLHDFSAAGKTYGSSDIDLGLADADERHARLEDVLRKPKDVMIYEYDFGDGWEHRIVLEKILVDENGRGAPSCIDGARACPPDDCGGPWGYAELLKVISDPSNPEHEAMLEWLGDPFDPEHFDPSGINRVLAKMRLRSPGKRSKAKGRKSA